MSLTGTCFSHCQVFSGFFPEDTDDYALLRKAIEKLSLNDSSVSVTPDASAALGQGFRIGFLGLLHMEVFKERLENEFNQSVIVTAPNVPYRIKLNNKRLIKFHVTDEITDLNPENVGSTVASTFGRCGNLSLIDLVRSSGPMTATTTTLSSQSSSAPSFVRPAASTT